MRARPVAAASSDRASDSTSSRRSRSGGTVSASTARRYQRSSRNRPSRVSRSASTFWAEGFLLHAGRILSFFLYDPDRFTYDPGRAFSSYNIEQQGVYAERIYVGLYPNNIKP